MANEYARGLALIMCLGIASLIFYSGPKNSGHPIFRIAAQNGKPLGISFSVHYPIEYNIAKGFGHSPVNFLAHFCICEPSFPQIPAHVCTHIPRRASARKAMRKWQKSRQVCIIQRKDETTIHQNNNLSLWYVKQDGTSCFDSSITLVVASYQTMQVIAGNFMILDLGYSSRRDTIITKVIKSTKMNRICDVLSCSQICAVAQKLRPI